jgi:hypothetical protein
MLSFLATTAASLHEVASKAPLYSDDYSDTVLTYPANHAQCDEKRPTCGNCKKSARECPGYPDEFDLVFRDENKAMAKKARKSSGPTPSNSSNGTSSSSHTSPHLYVLVHIV